jgi:hypothetical protein
MSRSAPRRPLTMGRSLKTWHHKQPGIAPATGGRPSLILAEKHVVPPLPTRKGGLMALKAHTSPRRNLSTRTLSSLSSLSSHISTAGPARSEDSRAGLPHLNGLMTLMTLMTHSFPPHKAAGGRRRHPLRRLGRLRRRQSPRPTHRLFMIEKDKSIEFYRILQTTAPSTTHTRRSINSRPEALVPRFLLRAASAGPVRVSVKRAACRSLHFARRL